MNSSSFSIGLKSISETAFSKKPPVRPPSQPMSDCEPVDHEPYCHKLDRQIASLVKNEDKIENYHNNSICLLYTEEEMSRKSTESADTLSSYDEDELTKIFQCDGKYRFENDLKIQQQ